jgi:hypothetical protein
LTGGGNAADAVDHVDVPTPDVETADVADVGAAGGATLIRRLRWIFGPPLVAMLAGWATIAYRSPYSGSHLFSPNSFARWDSGQYIRIARLGYNASWNCHAKTLPPHMPPGDYLCGNTGWFPGYPAAMRVVSSITSMSVPTAGLVISWVCWYLVLVLMWQLLSTARSVPTRWMCLFIAAFFPGQIYYPAIFPISLTVAGILGCLYVALRTSKAALAWVGFVAGFVAGYSYITAIVVAPALLITSLVVPRGRRTLQLLIPALGAAVGFGAVLITMKHAVGLWNAYFLSAHKYNVGAHQPIETLINRMVGMWKYNPRNWRLTTTASQTALTLFLVVLVTLVTIGSAIRGRRGAAASPVGAAGTDAGGEATDVEAAGIGAPPARSLHRRFAEAVEARISPFDLTFLTLTIGIWLVPYIAGGTASTYRSEAFVIVSVPLLRKLPPWALAVPLVAVVVVSWHMSPYFFNSQLA